MLFRVDKKKYKFYLLSNVIASVAVLCAKFDTSLYSEMKEENSEVLKYLGEDIAL